MDLLQSQEQPKKTQRKKSAAQRLWSIHWWMAIVYVLLFVGGTYMSQLPRAVAYRGAMYDFHKSLGVITMALLTVRILFVLLKLQRKSPAKRPLPNWERVQAIALHTLLYGFMLVVPLSGWFFSNSFGKGVAVFGIPMPHLFPADKGLAELGRSLHFWLAYTFLAFIALHSLDQRKYLRATLRRWFQRFRKSTVNP
jgi:cytochrome b561